MRTKQTSDSGHTIEVNGAGYLFFALFLLFAFSQNLLALISSNYSTAATLIFLTMKDITISFFVYYALSKSFPKIGLLNFIILILAIIVICISVFSPRFDVRQLRTALNLHLLFLFGLCLRNFVSQARVKNLTIFLLTTILLSGYIEHFLLRSEDEYFFNWAGFKNYYTIREGTTLNLDPSGVPGSWTSYDLLTVFGPINRMASLIILDPLLFSHAMTLPAIYFASSGRYFYSLPFLIAIGYSFSKGGYLVLAIAAYFYLILQLRGIIFKIVTSIAFLTVFLAAATILSSHSSAVQKHLEGLSGVVPSLFTTPFGKGLGTGGNLAIRELREKIGTSNVDFSAHGAESYFGGIVHEFGLFGAASYMLFGYLLFRSITNANNSWSKAIQITATATWISGFLAETPISMVGTGYIFILACLKPTDGHRAHSVEAKVL